MCRYRVILLIPSSSQSWLTVVSGLPIAACAKRSLAGVMTERLPPKRPLARAASKPAVVRSLMMSRSNSAKAPKM